MPKLVLISDDRSSATNNCGASAVNCSGGTPPEAAPVAGGVGRADTLAAGPAAAGPVEDAAVGRQIVEQQRLLTAPARRPSSAQPSENRRSKADTLRARRGAPVSAAASPWNFPLG